MRQKLLVAATHSNEEGKNERMGSTSSVYVASPPHKCPAMARNPPGEDERILNTAEFKARLYGSGGSIFVQSLEDEG